MKQSRLHAQHIQLGATFEEVTGWEMPAHYGDWRAEYDAVRQAVEQTLESLARHEVPEHRRIARHDCATFPRSRTWYSMPCSWK